MKSCKSPKPIDFTREMTYRRGLFLTFAITPIASSIYFLYRLITLALAPIGVIITARFIDTVLEVVYDGNLGWANVMPLLFALAALNMYGFIIDPLINMLWMRQGQKEWMAVDHPMVKTFTALEVKHTENKDTMDLINRVWGSPHQTLMQMWSNMTGFLFSLGRVISYGIILIASAPLAGAVTIIAAVPMIVVARKTADEKYRAQQEMTQYHRLYSMHLSYLANKHVAAERSLFGFVPMLFKKFRETFEMAQKYSLKINIKWQLRHNIAGAILTCVGAITLFMMLPGVAEGSISVGTFIALIGVLFSSISYVAWEMAGYFQTFMWQRHYLKEFNQYLSLSKAEGALEPMSETIITFEKLELKNVKIVYDRIENFNKREKFDFVIARAVCGLNTLLEYSLPFLKIGGSLVAYKGQNYNDEIEMAKNALRVLDGKIDKIIDYQLQINDDIQNRYLIIVKKIKDSDRQYPRGQNKPRLKPL